MGWSSRNLHHQLSGPDQSRGLHVRGHHAANFFHLVRISVSVEQFRTAHQTVIKLLQGGTKDSVITIWLIYFSKLSPVLTQLLFFAIPCSHPFKHQFLSQASVTRRRPWRLQLFFLQTRQVEDSGVESVPGRSQGVLLCYNFTVWKETMSSPFTGPVAP